MIKVLSAVAAVVCASAFAANTWYVDDDWYGKGGDGFDNRYSGTTAKVHLYHCTVRDCVSYGGVVRNVQAHRCLVLNNVTDVNNGACQSVTLDNSIVCGTRNDTGGQSNTYINCVVAGCSGKAGYGCAAYNTIYAMNDADFDSRDGASQVLNNVFNSSISTITLETVLRRFSGANARSAPCSSYDRNT